MSIGLQQTQYSILDSADYQFLCAEIQSGSVAERDIEIHYTVTDTGMDCSIQGSTKCIDLQVHEDGGCCEAVKWA